MVTVPIIKSNCSKFKSEKNEGLEFIKSGEYLCIRHGHHTIDIFLCGYLLIDDVDVCASTEGNGCAIFLDYVPLTIHLTDLSVIMPGYG